LSKCRRILVRDAKVDLERIDHRRQHGGVGLGKSDVVVAVGSPVGFSVHMGRSQERCLVVRLQLHSRWIVLVDVDIKLPKLSVLEVDEVQEDHERVGARRVILPLPHGDRRVVSTRHDGRLQDGRRHAVNGVRLNGPCGRYVHPPWAGFVHGPPKTVVPIIRVPSPNQEKVIRCIYIRFDLRMNDS